MEETETQKTKVSDSGYSNSCSNSQSQRSSRSSKSRHSTSSGSSGYCAHLPNINDGDKPSGKRKDKDHKKKKDGQNSLLPPSPKFEPLSPHVRENGRREDSSQHDHADIANEALQLAALAQTLTTVKRLKSKSQQPDVENSSPREKSMDQWTRDEVMQLVNEETTLEEELDMLVSMDDGLVIYTTQGLTHILGYPKDMWIGRSLIDLIHPKHRATFAGHITSVIASNDTGSMKKNIFCCYLRQYRGLRSCGFSVSEKWVGYLPFELNISFRQTVGEAPKVCLAITASQIKSSYKYTNETKMSSKFTTRHTASAQLCHVDPQVTPHFGYLPQDIIGRSILEFYHPEDLHFLKEVYEAVMKEQGHPFKSKPYRFRCQNGGFALVETELLSFINPWSRKLEFIICQHTVLRGPPNPDVTTPVAEPETLQISEEVLKETKIIQEEIKCLLNERVVRSSETVKQQVSKRCKDLAVFMENLMDELTKPPHLKVDVPTEENNFSEQDSVMLGEISPHHEYYDSKLSTETPPSYNQLNYNENIQRFFESKPKTTLSEESKAAGSGEEGKVSPATDSKVDSKSGGSGGSSGTQSTATVSNEYSPGLNTNTSNNNLSKRYKPTALTEQLLCRHNEDMEKQMVKKHRELRSKSDRDTKIKERLKALDKPQEENNTHGIKRSGSRSWEGEPYKSIKAAHNIEGVGPIPITNCKQAAFPQSQELIRPGFTSTLMPMYYLSNRRPDVLFPQQLPYLGGMVYQPVMFSPRPLVYSPLTMVPTPNLSQSPENPRPPVQQLSTDAKHGKCNLQSATAVAHDQAADSSDTSVPFDDSSSSFYSLLKTEKSDDSLRSPSENDTKQEEPNWRRGKKGDGKPRPIRKVAPWIEDINVTEELVLKYQLRERPLEEVLSQDLQALQSITQPELVTEQLSQMYLDLELEGLSRQLALEEDSSSSESSGDEGKVVPSRRKYLEYDKMVILFEEDAPLPPPIAHRSCT